MLKYECVRGGVVNTRLSSLLSLQNWQIDVQDKEIEDSKDEKVILAYLSYVQFLDFLEEYRVGDVP